MLAAKRANQKHIVCIVKVVYNRFLKVKCRHRCQQLYNIEYIQYFQVSNILLASDMADVSIHFDFVVS